MSLDVTACHWMLLHVTVCHCMSLDVTACHWMLLHVTVCHCMSLDDTGCYCMSLNVIACCFISPVVTELSEIIAVSVEGQEPSLGGGGHNVSSRVCM